MKSPTQLSIVLTAVIAIASVWVNAQTPALESDKKMFTISGNAGVPGVIMRGLPGDPTTDEKGFYTVEVPYGWKGVVRPEGTGLRLVSPWRSYEPVTCDLTSQNYTMARTGRPPSALGQGMAQDVLVVPTMGVNAAEFAETAEDMRVMLQILREKANEQRAGMGRGVLPDYGPIFGQSGRGTEAFYIQGYAAMFVMEVGFPLVRPSEPNAAGGRGQERAGDPVWQQARERLAGSGQSGSLDGANPVNPDQFKENLIRALRHAANIRHLDPNERVILTVIGSAGPASLPGGGAAYRNPYGGGSFSVQGDGYGYGGGSFSTNSTGGYTDSSGYTSFSTRGGRVMGMGAVGPAASAAGNVLTIQAKKADIDAFAKDQISFEQFSQRVKVFSY
jgi:hypothetical protein